jgi:hypothetical protein
MIKINNVANTWLIPSYSRNAVSTYLLRALVKDDFEIEVSVKTDWNMIKKSEQKFSGIAVLNGLHFGIICKVDDSGGRLISGEVWTEVNGKNHNEVVQIELDHKNDDSDWRDIKFTYIKNKSITLETTEGKKTKELDGNIVDYKHAYLWLGCCDNHLSAPDEYRGNWFGKVKKLKIQGKNKTFADFDFKRKTRYKIYDKSGNGNHLMKKFINEKGHVMVF